MNDWYKNAFWFLAGAATCFILMFSLTMLAVVSNPAAFR